MKVNMTPNPLDVVTIHASQGDTEARQWEFELHNNGELIDTSEITEQLFFKAYKGGTEQILPENTSTPTTSPFKGDIKYPQGLLTDQEFTYRQSPTEEDGLAKITDIKGNTLVWNQLCRTLTSGNWAIVGAGSGTLTFADGVATFSTTNNYGRFLYTPSNLVSGHKYLLSVEIKAYVNASINYALGGQSTYGSQGCICSTGNVKDANWHRYTSVGTFTSGTDDKVLVQNNSGASNLHEIQVRNIMYFDLTQMGLDITDPSDFTSLFSLPYYAYNQGSLLSFNGNGIKTVSKNQFDTQVITTSYDGLVLTKTQGTIRAVYSGGSQYAGFNFYGSPVFTDTFLKGKYRLSFDVKGLDTQWTVGLRQGASFLGGEQALAISNDGHYSFTIDAEANPNCYLSFARTGNKITAYDVTFSNIQLELGTTETPYTPFEEKTISLPISTYFPTGMKSAGSVYDEITGAKAITRIGSVDLGSLTWTYGSSSGSSRFQSTGLNGIIATFSTSEKPNIICAKYPTFIAQQTGSATFGITAFSDSVTMYLRVLDSNFTSASAFKTAMSGVYLYYELATPTETAVDLDLDFKSYEGGTEQLLPVNDSVPSTSPIIADMTYLSIDDAMEYIIDKLANVPQNTQQILNSLKDDVADLQEDVGALQPAVSALQTSVGNINTNIGQLSSTVAGHTASISDMQSDITDLNTGLSNLEDTVTDNTSRIGTLETGLSTTNGNVQSLSSQVQSIDGRVTNLESDLFKIVVKEFDYETVASETNFGTTTPITQEEGYRIIGVVGTEAQAGEYTSPASNIALTQCHVHYTSLGALTLTIFGRNNGASSRTNVRIYAYLLCIKDIQ